MPFQIGEKVVYPNQGVGTIENISSRSFGCNFEKFYLLRISCNSLTVVIPFSNAENVGLRPVSKDRDISRILSFLAHGQCAAVSDWKIRYRDNTEKMQSGDLYRTAEVFKTLLLLQREKPLSFREKKMFEHARQMLIAEIATARRLSERQAADLLGRALAKASLKLPAPS